jgi:phospholipase C
MKVQRRDFLQSVASASGAALLGSGWGWSKGSNFALPADTLPVPGRSGIQHIVVVTMENRSFDHFLGWFPNANTQQNATYPTPGGGTQITYPLAPDYQGCGHPNPDHSYNGGRSEYNGGRMDGWLLDPSNDPFCVGYYQEADIPFLAALARNYTTLDHYFVSILGPTYPNRQFLLAAQTDRLDDSLKLTSLPTIFDRLKAAGVSAGYYYNNVPFLALWGLKYLPISHLYARFLLQAALGTLPAVSFVDPWFTILDDDLGTDDEPHSDIRRGDAFLAATFRAVASGPAWRSTVFIITFDEWGGFFDHVAPPRAASPANSPDTDLVDGKALLGFRVPTIVASPWTRGGPSNPTVNSTVFDHTSILKLIEWRWGLAPLTARDASDDIGNLGAVLNFGTPNNAVPSLPHPSMPPATPCSATSLLAPSTPTARQSVWSELANSNLLKGWQVPKGGE